MDDSKAYETSGFMISVIIPTYNYGHFIGDAIQCIINQSYTNWEIIVVDDDSTDNTPDIVKRFAGNDNRIQYIHQQNSGPSAARNTGLRYCRGQYIQFLDPDDLIERRKFEVEISIFNSVPDVDVVYSNLRYFTYDPYDPADRKFSFWGAKTEWIPKFEGKGSTFLANALKGNFTHLSSVLFKKGTVDKVGGFDVSNSAPSDYTFILHCVINDAIFLYHDDPETYSLVRWHANNLSKNLKRMLVDEINMRKELRNVLATNTEATRINEYIIKGETIKLNNSWKRHFLSGGKFDFIKRIIRTVGLEKLFLKVFYK